MSQDISDLGKFADPVFANAFALIENRYFLNGGFLREGNRGTRDNNYLLENIESIGDIPIYIVHGRYDQVCPRFQADELAAACRAAAERRGARCVSSMSLLLQVTVGAKGKHVGSHGHYGRTAGDERAAQAVGCGDLPPNFVH